MSEGACKMAKIHPNNHEGCAFCPQSLSVLLLTGVFFGGIGLMDTLTGLGRQGGGRD